MHSHHFFVSRIKPNYFQRNTDSCGLDVSRAHGVYSIIYLCHCESHRARMQWIGFKVPLEDICGQNNNKKKNRKRKTKKNKKMMQMNNNNDKQYNKNNNNTVLYTLNELVIKALCCCWWQKPCGSDWHSRPWMFGSVGSKPCRWPYCYQVSFTRSIAIIRCSYAVLASSWCYLVDKHLFFSSAGWDFCIRCLSICMCVCNLCMSVWMLTKVAQTVVSVHRDL